MKKIGFVDTDSIVMQITPTRKRFAQFDEWLEQRKHIFPKNIQTKENNAKLCIESKNNISENEIGCDVLLINNSNKVDKNKEIIYNAIIHEFQDSNMSSASIYIALQNIPFIDIVEDVIVIYLKQINLFDKLNIPCINIKKSLNKRLGNKNLKIKFVQYQPVSIADFFANNYS